MVLSIHVGFRHCGKKTISVIVDYTIKSRQLNPTTVIYVVDVELLDGGETKYHWCIRFLVLNIEAFRKSFHDFLEKFIRSVLITDSVLSSIGAFELMEFQNGLEQLDFPKQQQTALNILRDYISSIGGGGSGTKAPTRQSVLSSIGAFALMEFQNGLKQLDFAKQQQTALNILRDYISSIGGGGSGTKAPPRQSIIDKVDWSIFN